MIVAAASQAVTGYAVIAGVVLLVLNQLGVLDWLGLKRKSAADAAAELEVSDRLAKRLRDERNHAREEVAQLALQRTNEPVLELLRAVAAQIEANADAQTQVIDRLAKHNGSFAHMEASLGTISEGLKALMGTIAELHGLPLTEPHPRREGERHASA